VLASAVNREHERIALADPRSPRVKPTLPPIRGAADDGAAS
jgi:hypothetical protein